MAHFAHSLFRLRADFENFVSYVPMGFAEGLDDLLVAFDKLYGGPVGMIEVGQSLFPGKALFQGTKDRIDLGTVADAQRFHAPLFTQSHCLAQDFLGALAATGNERHAGGAFQMLGQALHVDVHAGLSGLVHHVAGKNDGHAHFHDLHSQKHAAL